MKLNSDNIDKSIYDRYYKFSITIMKLLGIWPMQRKSDARLKCFLFVFINVTVGVPLMLVLPKQIHIIEDLLVTIIAVFYCIGCTTKYLISYNSAPEITALYQRFFDDWADRDQKELAILHKISNQGRFLVRFFTAFAMFTIYPCMAITSFIPYFLDAFIPIENVTRVPSVYYHSDYIFFNQSDFMYTSHLYINTCYFLNVTLVNTIISLEVISVHHICGLLKIIHYRLENLKPYNGDPKQYAQNLKYLKITAYLHDKAIKSPELLESVISLPFLIIEMMVVLALSLMLLYLVRFPTQNLGKSFAAASLSLGFIVFFFYINWNGQLVVNHSEKIFFSTYTNNWYLLSHEEKMIIKFMMHRSEKPVCIVAGKLLELSLLSYANLLKATLSYGTVLMSLN